MKLSSFLPGAHRYCVKVNFSLIIIGNMTKRTLLIFVKIALRIDPKDPPLVALVAAISICILLKWLFAIGIFCLQFMGSP